jgi:hypothetical protein
MLQSLLGCSVTNHSSDDPIRPTIHNRLNLPISMTEDDTYCSGEEYELNSDSD